MAAFDFPASPSLGAVYGNYTWDGEKWLLTGGAAADAPPESGSFPNKFRNGAFQVWQRGTALGAVNNAYAADGWIVTATGAAVGVSRANNVRPNRLTSFAHMIVGGAGVTGALMKQRIEGSMAAPLAGLSVTVQAQVRNDTGGTITPTLTVKHATALDNWGATVTDVAAAAMQACADGAWTKVSYTFTAHASSDLGLEVAIDFGNNLSSGAKSVTVSEADIRASAAVVAPAFREFTTDLLFNQRYYWRLNSSGAANYIFMAQVYTASAAWGSLGLLPTPMRAVPTCTISSQGHLNGTNSGGSPVPFTAVTFGANSVSQQVIGPSNLTGASGLAAGNATIVNFNNASAWIDASAEL
jgi:hypothetical protein